MKKRLNGNRKKFNKKIITYIVVAIFLFYFSLALVLSERKYLYSESIFKIVSSNINSYFINKMYSNENYSSNLINSKVEYLEKENNDLKEMLNIKLQNTSFLAAEVVNHNSKLWFNKITINKGYEAKLKKDLPVVNELGLVGFISKTGKKVSEVTLLTDINENNMLSVFIETEDGFVAGMLSDYDAKNNLFKVSEVSNQSKIKEGNNVVLSGYDNQFYKGIYVGKVVKEQTVDYGLSKDVWISQEVNYDDLMFVMVLTEGE